EELRRVRWLLDQDERRGEELPRQAREPPRLDDLAHDRLRHGTILVAPNGQQGTDALEDLHDQWLLPLAARMASHTRSGVTGISMCSTPSSARASTTALTTAATAGLAP